MRRCPFLTVTDWPSNELSEVGRLTASWTGEAEDHIGVFVPFCTDVEVVAHSDSRISEASAHGERHVSFDFMSDLMPRFQSIYNEKYYTPHSRTLFYPVLHADASDVHDACLDVAEAAPRNYCCHRFNAIFWCWPMPCCCCPAQQTVAQSTCVALSARIVAAAATGMVHKALTSDAFVFHALGIDRFSWSTPSAPFFLAGHTPRSAAAALLRAGVVGAPVGSVADAIAMCQQFPAAGAVGGKALLEGRSLPLLPLSRSGAA